jgi:hypothetical protein
MAKRDGSVSMWKHMRELSRLRGKYGAPARLEEVAPGANAAILQVSNVVANALTLDDQPLVIDLDLPEGPEDGA